MKYRSLIAIIRFFLNIIADVEVSGMEKLPQGNVLIALNHLGRLDTLVLLSALDRDDIIVAIARKYKYHPIIGVIGRVAKATWINQSETDFSALREILARLQKGGLMIITPEGTRSKTAAMQRGKMGVAFLASKSGYPVLPVALYGMEDAVVIENLKRFRRSKMKAVAGDLFFVEVPQGKGREQSLREATDEIMCRIAANLPEKYRGYYAEHPRLKEILDT